MVGLARSMKRAKIAAANTGQVNYQRNTERLSRQQRNTEVHSIHFGVGYEDVLGIMRHCAQSVVCLRAFCLALLLVAGCDCDVVTSKYPTRADAKADTPFAHGWLPDFLPESSKDIVTHNNLDSTTSWGEFRFEPRELDMFLARLTSGGEIPRRRTFDPLREKLKRHGSQDHRSYSWSDGGHTWLFLVNSADGHVFYCMWPNGRGYESDGA